MKVLQEYAKNKIKNTFCVNTEVGFGVIWKTISIDQAFVEKIHMTGKNISNELNELVVPQQIEKKFGGNVDNKIKNYFPPREASYNYGFDKFRLVEVKKRKNSLKLGGVGGLKKHGGGGMFSMN